jgi:hypothetical protein
MLMKHRDVADSRIASSSLGFLVLVLLLSAGHRALATEPTPAACAAFDAYAGSVEARLAQQHRTETTFLSPAALGAQGEAHIRQGEPAIERLTPSAGAVPAGAMLHHWRGTAFVPGASVADFERLMEDFSRYPEHFYPQVLRARFLARQADQLQAEMRVRQQHVLTVVMDTAYDIRFGQLDAQHGFSIAHSTRISEIDSPGTSAEHALDAQHEHGFLWRQNTYWSYEERDGGLSVQVESVSLTRDVPRGLVWAVGPFVESVPRESLAFTLTAVSNALRKPPGQQRQP